MQPFFPPNVPGIGETSLDANGAALILTRHAAKGKPPLIDVPSSEGAKDKLGIANLKEGDHVAEAAFG
jgi:hypothetical protein